MKKNDQTDRIMKVLTGYFSQGVHYGHPVYKSADRGRDFINAVETEGESYEQKNYRQASSDIVELGIVLMDNQKEIMYLRETVDDLEQNASYFQKRLKKTEKKLKKQSKELHALKQQNHKYTIKVKKNRQQVKLLTKTMCAMGTYLGLNKVSGSLKHLQQNCMNSFDEEFMNRSKKQKVIDSKCREIE